MKQWMVKFSSSHPYVSVVLSYTAYVIIVIAIGLIFHLSISYDGIYYLVFIVIGHLFYVRHQRNKK